MKGAEQFLVLVFSYQRLMYRGMVASFELTFYLIHQYFPFTVCIYIQ